MKRLLALAALAALYPLRRWAADRQPNPCEEFCRGR